MALSSKYDLQVLRAETRPFCNSGKHTRAKFLIIMKGKHKIRPTGTGKCTVRTRLPLDRPTYVKKGSQNTPGTRAGPLAHAAANEMLTRSGPASPCSRRSAMTRNARAWTFDWASADVLPYARTPGKSVTSAIQRPSSSCSISTRKFIRQILRLCTPLEKDPGDLSGDVAFLLYRSGRSPERRLSGVRPRGDAWAERLPTSATESPWGGEK